MNFDKSKVCVAGLHEVKEGTKGWFADSVNDLEEIATQNSANECLFTMKGQRDCLYVGITNTVWRFFYPAPEKQYRPFETIEEAQIMKGKWIRSKDRKKLMMITSIYIGDVDNELYINGYRPAYIFENFVMDETGEPVGVEV